MIKPALNKQEFGAFIKRQRKRHGYSLSEISERLGITRSGYIRKENGVNPFTLPEVINLSYYLKFHLETIESFYLANHKKPW